MERHRRDEHWNSDDKTGDGIVWKNDELRGKNIEAKRDVAEKLRQDVGGIVLNSKV